ncbi:MAG: NAD(+)/NADH kinase [Clostridia bacterium]|nr:NAD(+)/NADH kinase [Clostridia bacterium]
MKVALFPNYERQGTQELLSKIVQILASLNIDCYTEESKTEQGKDLYEYCDVIITIGGDGTLIKHAKEAAKYGKHCIGVNTGNLGFLANVDKDTIELLEKLKTGDYLTESRMMLEVTATKNGKVLYSGMALNDAVVSSERVARIADIKLGVSGDEIAYRADGVIVSTPTGSTAYSMSAGGPIIDPAVRCLTVTPVCSHSLTARPMILSESTEIDIAVQNTSRTTAILSVDGQRCAEVDFDTTVSLKKSDFVARFINLTGSTIYKTVSKKF